MKYNDNMKPRFGLASQLVIAGLAVLTAVPGYATDGYFDYGYGVKAKGIGGAGVAFPQDGLAPATNPAGAAFLEDQLDFGLSYFRPNRSADFNGGHFDGNGKESFYVPEIGAKYSLTSDLSLALAVYGNGGMNTDYAAPLFDTARPGTPSNTSMNLEQLFIAPTLAYKVADGHAFGVSPIFAYQRFKATGFEEFGVASAGNDDSIGGGVRVGYTGVLTDWLSVGATYQSRIYASRFDKYSGLFAGQGDFDIPSNFALGFAVHPIKPLTWAFDVERILYSEVNSVGNQLTPANSQSLGADNGPGFGWKDVTVIKTGIAYEVTDTLTLRVGYNYSTQPIRDSQTYFNILAPGVVQHHATAGVTWKFRENWDLSAFYAHAFEQKVSGDGPPFGVADLAMKQDTFGLSVGWQF